MEIRLKIKAESPILVRSVCYAGSHGKMQAPRIKMSTYGSRAFGHAGSYTWNAFTNIFSTQHILLCLLLDVV